MPILTQPIDDLDFSWADLSLSFLWWPGAQIFGMEKRCGRLCYVIDIPAPDESTNTYAGVRVWIDPEVNMLLQAEGYDQEKERIRKLQVKSLAKVDDLWTIKNVDVTTYPTRHKTTLRVQDVEIDNGELSNPQASPITVKEK